MGIITCKLGKTFRDLLLSKPICLVGLSTVHHGTNILGPLFRRKGSLLLGSLGRSALDLIGV
jgi:hypothetical protein